MENKSSPIFAKSWFYLVTVVLGLGLSGCSSTTVKSANETPLSVEQQEIAEAELLDVGILEFNNGLDITPDEDEDFIIFPAVRNAETKYFPYLLMETMQKSAGWGPVRMVPANDTAIDLLINGTILQSDGETLRLKISVTDSTGASWMNKEYKQQASKYAYDKRLKGNIDPFQDIYNRIANDILSVKRQMSAAQVKNIRQVTEVRFAHNFSKESFTGHLAKNENGHWQVQRLPAQNDPMMNRIRDIRERDYLFVDTLQGFYGSFIKEMNLPYQQWRKESYDEVLALQELKKKARNEKIAGAAAILGGILASGSASAAGRAAGAVSIMGGAYLVKGGYDREAEASLHVEALQELGDSVESALEPKVIELEDRTITLTGNVQAQYSQWVEILKKIYQTEQGQ